MSSTAPRPILLPADRLTAAIAQISARIGAQYVITDASDMEGYLVEQRGLFRGATPAVVRPGSTEEVAFVVKTCAEAGIPIVPQGGNTGLVGGQVPFGALLLSLGRLNKVRALDATDLTLTAEAGCTLHQIQQAADAADCLFPLSIASEGTCQIGGNLATNAGGTAVLRYGNTRDLTLGLEVVLADGRVWNGLSRLRKDNTGYDLKNLFVGSEGTLGIITAAVLRLFPKPRRRATALVGVTDVHQVLALFRRLRAVAGDTLTGFEFLPDFGMETVLKHMSGAVRALQGQHAFYALAELTSTRADDDLAAMVEGVLAEAFEAGEVEDAVIAASEGQSQALWKLREDLSEAQKFEGGSIKHDVSVPVSRVAEFVEQATAACEAHMPGLRVCAFGHIGDGNVHFNLSQPVGMDKTAYLDTWEDFNRIVHDIVVSYAGSISAEHGIGFLKREELVHYKDPVALDVMASIKAALDPAGLLNPGKMLVAKGE
ncbi:FAD/FMN-containing dehydrogenases [Azorhizobium caulinodans ORS 571]|uniref:FAD/FMN-containing dehydrogenases n=1 Tax=Azorhizobium caulinodans (strain ATCC 43989 / DSM 5975 / JCM 20966 / LMG 6465 / NBRC 14845 / NCIMB 13405 / ORS 571) TaxID=438753 RepID=A8HSW4_AZOC5|nr:FAD-binding oxidoreductase [Azorhizobium caulinodans]BAF90223.1 FAD/FMN-containing dehydrogenases [Azorhizobium caulinodans ORS 571]